jgi:hypothetical protein
VATVLVSERDGFIKLQADNFTFSSPTIKVKFSQESVAPAAIPAKVEPKKSSSITCIKGKTSKKITGLNPKCPAGYKKR